MSASYMRKCASKDRHDTKEAAVARRASLTGSKDFRGKGQPDVYHCDQCLGWHIGNSGRKFVTRGRRSGKRPNKRMRGR